ncbi:MMPL family transporter [Nocardioides sp. InS609-2]|uniref:MMPL family transporter n=1 Tax=Nocardioides sp. InS609-2 TaxID=2760705 RepID=UPI0020BDD777|nr:MMPL family transporter [Nocardioides sp. InS609-2]
MERFARLVMRHRRIVSAVWVVLFLGGLFSAGQLSDRLSLDFSLPGQPGDDAEQQLIETYGVSTFDTYVAVVTVPAGETVEENQDAVAQVFDAAVAGVRDVELRVITFESTGDEGFITDDGRTTFALLQAPIPVTFGPYIEEPLEPALTNAAEARGFESGLTSYGLLAAGGDTEGPSVLVETLFGAAGALLVLIFVFASFLALLPMLIAAVSILTTFMLVLGLTTFSDVSVIVQFLIALIGLGVAIDYSLLLVSRWREERAHGRGNEEAVIVAMKTAGHAVLASGVTVAISLVALLVVPVPFLRSMGTAGMLIPLVSVSVVLTLLPALLSSVGPRVDYPRIRHEGKASRGWSAWARIIVKHRLVAATSALVMLAILIIPVFDLKIGQSGLESQARSGPRYEALQVLRDGGIGGGILTPVEILVPTSEADAAAKAAREVDGVQAAVIGSTQGDEAVVDVLPTDVTVDSSGTALVDDIRTAVEGAVDGDVGVTGLGATVEDYFSAVYDKFPYVLALISLITFVLLVRTFRSVLLPLKAVILNLLSLAAVFGSVVFFWQMGNGSDAIFSVSGTGAITFWLPVLIFAFLFGLSMDYEVFILARMREEYDRTGDTGMAVITGIGRTGRLVTSAALILFFAFSALASSPGTDIKVLGTALGVGILIDATIVRALLVPALVTTFGRWNWWLPAWLARVLWVEPSPLAPRGRRTPSADTAPANVN